jgi:hypothetical protein
MISSPFGNQDALDFAQNLVRIVVEFEGMRHHHQVDAVALRKGVRRRSQRTSTFPDSPASWRRGMRFCSSRSNCGSPSWIALIAEKVGNHRIDVRLFPGHDVAPLRALQPDVEAGN